MTEMLLIIVRVLAYAVIVLCLVIVVGKVVWNIGLPYAMLRGPRRGWSIFPLIEIVPLLVAIGVSFLVSGHGILSPRSLAIWGFAAIVGSYCHFAFVGLCHAILQRWRGDRDAKQ